LAGQIVAGKALRRVRDLGSDLVRRIGEKRVPLFDKFSERTLTNFADIGRRPLCQINRDRLCGRKLVASTAYTGTQNNNHQPNALHRARSLVAVGVIITSKAETCRRIANSA
jgi:hypothetical protein